MGIISEQHHVMQLVFSLGGKGQGGMEGGIRVPAIVRYPGVIPKGSVSVLPTSPMDIFPTVASMLGVPLPQDVIIDGVNILPHMSMKSTEPPHDFLVHWCGQVVHAARLVQGKYAIQYMQRKRTVVL